MKRKTVKDSISAPPSKTCSRIKNRNYFPSDVLKFIKLNAKSRISLKLMQLCKYFQHKKFLLIKSIKHLFGEWTYTLVNNQKYTKYRLEDVPDYLLITKTIALCPAEIDFNSFYEKIVVSDVEKISFVSQHQIPFKDFKVICGNVKTLNLCSTNLLDENGSAISLDDLLEVLPNLENISLSPDCPSIVSIERVDQVVPRNLKYFKVNHFDGNFNFGLFVDFMLQHQNIHYVIHHNKYLLQFQNHVNRIIYEWDCRFEPPTIMFDGQSRMCEIEMALLQKRYLQQKPSWLSNL